MADIRKRIGKKGTTYQVRYPNKATKSGYAFKTFDTLKEARAFREDSKARKKNAALRSGIGSVSSAIDKWLDICEREGRDGRDPVSPATLEQYIYRSRIMKSYDWENSPGELEEPDIVEFRSWLLRNYSRDTAQKVLSSFHSVLIEMKRRGLVVEDPAENVSIEVDSRYNQPPRIPTVSEFQEILKAADRLANSKNFEIAKAWERYRPMVYLAADSGMRPQEYLVLPVESIQESGIRIVQALDRSNHIGPTKTKAGRRYIPVSSGALDLVKQYAKKHSSGDFVFPTRRGGGYQRYNNYLRRGWHKLMEEAGMVEEVGGKGGTILINKKYTPYALRHFYASMLIEQNKSLKFIQTVMGHEDIKMTFDVYGHIIQEREAKLAGDEGGILPNIMSLSCGSSVASHA
ncbi:MAG: tyrosine-type recombinase/integrase [Candidatus Thiodiazotropha endolucinida]